MITIKISFFNKYLLPGFVFQSVILARREIIKQRTLLKRKLDFELKKTALI
jgi:hypothetical protein